MLELLKQCKYVERSSGERKPCPECVGQKRHRRGYISVACTAGHTWVWCPYCCDCAGNTANSSKQGCTNAMHWFERDSFDTGSRNHMQRHKAEAQCPETKKRAYLSETNTTRQPKVEEPAPVETKKSDRSRSCSVAERDPMLILGVPQFIKDEPNVNLNSLSTYFTPFNNLCASELSCKRFRVDPSYLGTIQIKDVVLDSTTSTHRDPTRVLPSIREFKSASSRGAGADAAAAAARLPPTLAALCDPTDHAPYLHDIEASSSPSPSSSSPSSPSAHDDYTTPSSSSSLSDAAAGGGGRAPPAYLEQQISELDSVGNAAFALVALRRAAGVYTC